MRFYRIISFFLAAIFALIGLIFLVAPARVIFFFNNMSAPFDLPLSPVDGPGFYVILAVAYMYLVSLLAWKMYRHPENRIFAVILVHAKLASALCSFLLFFWQKRYLIYLVNGTIDTLIGIAVLAVLHKIRTWTGA
jgi:hypothetical protein